MRRNGGHVGASGQLRLEHAHHLAHVLRTGGAGLRNRSLNFSDDLRVGRVGDEVAQPAGTVLANQAQALGDLRQV